ncbi:hypothetical protein PC116_g17747 [Phytophthora cactorum]|uniref:Uncharacterized protein n=1 Tax=Phytophthora cactorum TaxID=29920 RepID=A0A8T1KFH2_9STRA|nr:hypothetical protein PC114_g22986 [Phytophthora cactorum]KAG2928792.1 hypothetical protein PC117_g14211 [Phytophthora cactorum]KAG3131452.1 hypothetical protein C6341_g23339 [Phytophthora cactorum]KAG4234078.1 hypothetical protein PC116_g17747 [Phytophthora cactorum]
MDSSTNTSAAKMSSRFFSLVHHHRAVIEARVLHCYAYVHGSSKKYARGLDLATISPSAVRWTSASWLIST